MKFDGTFFSSPVGQLTLVGALAVFGVLAVIWQLHHGRAMPLPVAHPTVPFLAPRTFTRDVARFPQTTAALAPAISSAKRDLPTAIAAPPKPAPLPLSLFAAKQEPPILPAPPSAPYGRLIPCETVVTLESNRLETPVIGLVTEDVWHDGRLVVPAGAEVHGRAALDRTRERLAAEGQWRIVWRTPDRDNGTELTVTALALDRDYDARTKAWGEHDGSAGLRGQVIKTADDRELKLFAATFLATATAALQDTRTTAGLLGEATLPAATARNATLAGTGAVLREYAQQLREAIARDGLYLRVPAGKPFYLYVTQTLRRGATVAANPVNP